MSSQWGGIAPIHTKIMYDLCRNATSVTFSSGKNDLSRGRLLVRDSRIEELWKRVQRDAYCRPVWREVKCLLKSFIFLKKKESMLLLSFLKTWHTEYMSKVTSLLEEVRHPSCKWTVQVSSTPSVRRQRFDAWLVRRGVSSTPYFFFLTFIYF